MKILINFAKVALKGVLDVKRCNNMQLIKQNDANNA